MVALFLRREIQRRIDEAAAFLEKEKLHGLIRRLNLPNKACIEAQWELMWLTAFARIGQLAHEAPHPEGTSFPDAHYKSDEIEFVADITTASDSGYEDDNPMGKFRHAINRIYRKHRTKGGFTLKVDSRMVGKYGDRKVKLSLPTEGDLTAFAGEHFEPFVIAAMKNPEVAAEHSVAVEGGRIVLTYNPEQRPRNYEGSYLTFNVPYSLKKNPVYNVLKRKKEQLKKSGYKGLKGVIIGDASCRILHTSMSGGSFLSLRNIVLEFLKKTRSVDFVLTIGVEESASMSFRRDIRLKPALFFQPKMSEADCRALETVLSRALSQVPLPERAGYQAIYSVERGLPPDASFGAIGSSFTFGGIMHPTEIKVSGRLLAGLLSGEISHAEFRAAHELKGNVGKPPIYLFEQLVKEGCMIREARVEAYANQDDDHIILVFGPPDPAASKFRAPKAPDGNEG